MEIWKDVKGCEGYYQVSNEGRVRSLDRVDTKLNPLTGTYSIRKGQIRKQILSNNYLSVNLCINDKRKFVRVHRMVIEAFLPNIDNKPQINHINGMKLDNRLCNLEYCTASENLLHAHKTGLATAVNKKKITCIDTQQVFESSFKAAEWLNLTKFNNTKVIKRVANTLRICANGKTKIAYGYKWKFID
jgi:hypothetical protein